MPGFLLLNKPVGMTSHDVVDSVRRITGERRVGHAGTLDPFASGLLIIGVEREATKNMQSLSGLDKSYEARFVLGARSETDDTEGEIKPVANASMLKGEGISEAMKAFLGEIDQIPPAFSAVKIGGKKMYQEARAGRPIEAPARHVRVDRFELIGSPVPDEDLTRIQVQIDCGSGTYVRALARDLGKNLQVGGYAESLERSSIGPFKLDEAISPKDLTQENWEERLISVDDVKNRLANESK